MLVDTAANAAAGVTGSIVEAFLPHIFNSLMSMPPERRDAEVDLMPEPLRESIRSGIKQIEKTIDESNNP